MNDYKVQCDLPMHKDVYFFGHGIDIDNPYEIIDLKRKKRELIDYLKEQIKLCKEAQQLALKNKMIEQVGNFNLRIATYTEILSKIEKE